MSLKRKLATAAAGAMIVGSLLASPAAHATGDPSSLDQGDLSQACHRQYGYGWTAHLYGSTAYSWKCTSPSHPGDLRDVDVNKYCMDIWGVWAETTNPSSPYSWKCQGY